MKAKYYDLEKHKAEEHSSVASRMREIILGMQDGLVNVLGIILGVAAATSDARVVIIAGIAATFAESISMAAVAYTSTKAQAEYYESQLAKETRALDTHPDEERDEVSEIFYRKGFRGKLLSDIVKHVTSDKKLWADVMMSDELELEKVNPSKALRDAFLVGGSAFAGSFIPLLPFLFVPVGLGMWVSVIVSAACLFAIGAIKAKQTVGKPLKAGLELMAVGGLAALTGYVVGALLGVGLH